MDKVAILVFKYIDLHQKNINVHVLRDILGALPSDSKIVNILSSSITVDSNILVESNSFIDTKMYSNLPEIIINLSKDPVTGVTSFDSLDMSAALAAYNGPPSQQVVHHSTCPCSICSLPTPNASRVPTTSNWSKSILKSAIFSLARPNIGGFVGGCNHEWKMYNGLTGMNNFEYCTKCNEKKT